VSVRFALSAVVALAALGCGSASFDTYGGTPTSEDTGVVDDVALPDSPLSPDTALTVSDTGPDPQACAPRADGLANLCVRVNKGVAGPAIGAAEASLGIDGTGTLLVALAKEPPRRASDLVATATLPSVSSGAKLAINDLPMIAELGATPGKYYVIVLFRDALPYDRTDAQVGDWAPAALEPKDLPYVDLSDPKTPVTIDVPLFPVRGFDVTVRLASTVKPLGSGTGPVRVRMSASDGRKLGEGTLACGSVSNGATATVRVLTAATPTSFTLEGALFDFATGPDDPMLDATPLASGTLVTGGPSAADTLASSWLGPTHAIDLARVIPFVGPVPADPTSACYGVALK
jgi:hypothetical protein